MNPLFTNSVVKSGLLGAMSRGLVSGIGRQSKPMTKSRIRAKSKRVQNRRMHNKMARRSRRVNRILMKGK